MDCGLRRGVAAAGLRGVWLELRAGMRDVLERTTLADIAGAQRKT